jgi:biopolymer transport protein ExbB/TolQ
VRRLNANDLSLALDDVVVILVLATIAAIFAFLATAGVNVWSLIAGGVILLFGIAGAAHRIRQILSKRTARERLATLMTERDEISAGTEQFANWCARVEEVLNKHLDPYYLARFRTRNVRGEGNLIIEEFLKELR